MEAALLYLLKAHAVLALFVAAYYGLLRRLTFFRLNRAFLLLALLFAAAYPALPMPGLLPAEVPAAPVVAWVFVDSPAATTAVAALPAAAPGPDWPLLALGLYAGGVAVLLARLLVQLLALARLRRAARPALTTAGVAYRQLPAPSDPFSFGRTIYLYAGQHTAAELAVVLAHEQAHVRQAHTLDVLLAHLGTALFWPSPAAWLLRRAVLDNLEYLADAATLRTGLDRRAYQYCLLQLSRGAAGPALALPFTFFTLKNRVAMMNTPLSSRGQLARYFLAGPLVALAALGYSAAHARSAEPVELGAASMASPSAPASSSSLLTEPTSAPIAPIEKPTEKPQKPAFGLPQAARAYVASAYPQAKITGLITATPTATDPTAYVVAVKQNRQTLHPSFNAAGQFLGEKKGVFFFRGPVGLSTLAASSAKPVATRPTTSQPTPTSAAQTGPAPLYYIDGKAVTEAQLKALSPADIVSIKILKGEQARQLAGDKGRDGVAVITTKTNEGTASVIEFNKRVERIAPIRAEAGTFLVGTLPTDALYYLDGKPSTKDAVERLAQHDLAHVVVLSDQTSIRRVPGLSDSPATSVILVTTKANADAPAVRAFTEQADLASGYTFRPVGVNVLVPAALAYITSHYPDARLNEVQEQKNKTTGAVKYQVQLINGKRPFYVYFTPQGEFAGE